MNINRKKVKFKSIFTFLFISFNVVNSTIPDVKLSRVWGPGLVPHKIVMPARYFFIQGVDKHNNRVAEFCAGECISAARLFLNVLPNYLLNSLQTTYFSLLNSISRSLQNEFIIIIEGKTKQDKPCRIWSNLLDRKDGSLIVRYKVYETCLNLVINIKYKNEHVAESPYKINEIIYSDECNCPQKNIKELLDLWQCPEIPLQILNDFNVFENNVNWDELRPKIIKQFDKPHSVSLCHYIIKNNKLYRKCYGKYVGFNMFSDSILLSLLRKSKIPDLEFFINLGDWPLSLKDMPEKYPIFSWCGSNESYDIVMPTYELTEASLENMGRVMLDMLSVQGNVEELWDKREDKLFWRGRDSNRHRLNLITLSKKYPELFNVSLTNFFFYRDEEEVYGPKTDHVSFFRFFDYKYQLAIDGTVAAYRMPFLLAGGSLVFKPHSKYYEHFYSDLKPNTHYVSVETDLSDLIEKIYWAKNHDKDAKIIAANGQKFANENLLPKNIFCYHFHLLNKLSEVIVTEVKIFNDMELVNQKKDVPCDCLVENNQKDEL